MPDRNNNHRDCGNYAPVDAAKGVCHRTKEIIPADDSACAAFAALPKCAACSNYLPSEKDGLTGVCKASKNGFMAYAGMAAVTCENYSRTGG